MLNFLESGLSWGALVVLGIGLFVVVMIIKEIQKLNKVVDTQSVFIQKQKSQIRKIQNQIIHGVVTHDLAQIGYHGEQEDDIIENRGNNVFFGIGKIPISTVPEVTIPNINPIPEVTQQEVVVVEEEEEEEEEKPQEVVVEEEEVPQEVVVEEEKVPQEEAVVEEEEEPQEEVVVQIKVNEPSVVVEDVLSGDDEEDIIPAVLEEAEKLVEEAMEEEKWGGEGLAFGVAQLAGQAFKLNLVE